MQAPQVSASLAACLFAAVLTLSHRKLRCQLILRLGLRLPTAFREDKGAHLQATQKNVSAHTHSSTAILQLQRAGLRERITCSIAVIIITIICIRIIIISCIRSEQTDCSECWSVGRSCRCAGVLRNAALAPQQTPAAQRDVLTQRTGIFARSTRLRQRGRSRYFSLLSTDAMHFRKHSHHQLRIPPAAHTALRCAYLFSRAITTAMRSPSSSSRICYR